MATAVQVEALWNGLTDNNGDPLGGGKVYTYSAGTTTPASLYTSSDKVSSATNPIILDGYGRAQVWADGRYKFVVKTSADVTLYTLDNLLYGFDDSQMLWGGLSTGSANAQVVSTIATTTGYSNGLRLSFIAGYTNSGATTVMVNTLTAVNIVKGPSATALQAGDIVAGQLVNCTYYGGAFRLEDYPTVADLAQGRIQYATGAAGTNTITASLSPAPAQYEAGMTVCFKAAGNNTGATTINLNSLGAKTIQRYGVALSGGEIRTNDMVELVYDGTQFQLVNATTDPLLLNRATSQALFGDGTAAAPVVSFAADVNTGVFRAAADELAFSTGGSERVRIDASGRVGIGATSPTVPLEISAGGSTIVTSFNGSGTALTARRFTADANGCWINLQKSRNATTGSHTVVQDNDQLGVVYFSGSNGSAFEAAVNITASVDGAPAANVPGRLQINLQDSTGAAVTPITCKSSNRVGIGTATPGYQLHVATDSAGKPTTNTWTIVSDARIKTNIQPYGKGLAEILQVEPITYDYNGKGGMVAGPGGVSIIAQALQPVFPECVGTFHAKLNESDEQETELLNYNGHAITFALINAVKELASRVEALEAQIGG